jgi:hypothetical protein
MDDAVSKLFEDSWRARRELARAQHASVLAARLAEERAREVDDAKAQVERTDARLQALADKQAGVDVSLSEDTESPSPSGYVPIRR